MKLKGLLISLVLALTLTSAANAVTLVAGHTYQLAGNIAGKSPVAGYTQTYSLTPAGNKSYFTVNFDNTISVVLNLVGLSNGLTATLTIDKLTLSGTGTLAMNAPVGATTLSGGYKDVGNFLTAGVNTNFGIAMPGQLNAAGNTWKLWGAYFNAANVSLGGTDFHLTITGDITGNSSVPEPMSMSLLGMGLLGGVVSRRRKSA